MKHTRYVLAILFVFFALNLAAGELTTKMIKTRHRSLQGVLPRIRSALSEKGKITFQSSGKSLEITDRKKNLREIERIVEDYDIPLKRIEVIVKLIEADSSPREKSISNEIKDIGSRLGNVFRFTNYRLLDTAVIEGTEKSPSSTSLAGHYKISFKPGFVNRGKGVIKLKNFNLSKRKSGKEAGEFTDLLTTSLNLINGEQIVCGASRMEPEKKRSLILIISVKTLD